MIHGKDVKKMSDNEILEWLLAFADEIFENATRKNGAQYKEKLDAFVKNNKVSIEQMMEFAESGAGEELYMLYS